MKVERRITLKKTIIENIFEKELKSLHDKIDVLIMRANNLKEKFDEQALTAWLSSMEAFLSSLNKYVHAKPLELKLTSLRDSLKELKEKQNAVIYPNQKEACQAEFFQPATGNPVLAHVGNKNKFGTFSRNSSVQ